MQTAKKSKPSEINVYNKTQSASVESQTTL